MTGLSTRILDHIVHLTPPGTLQDSVHAFQNLGFTVSPGGTHTGGQTANALVVFADGTYLELLHFAAPPPPADPNPWAHKRPGWIDFAFLGNDGAPSVAETINRRAEEEGSGVRYAREVRGGRRREDGRVLEWLISGPPDGARETLPFFCGDLTPRDWRVPLEPRANTQHENTACGVAHVKLLVPPDALAATARQLTSVLGASPYSSTAEEVAWHLDLRPSRVAPPSKIPVLRVGAAESDEEKEYVRAHGAGIYEVGFAVSDSGQGRETKTPFGKIVWVGEDAELDLRVQ
ncbi:glyoxalase-like domain-containing protein [Dichomitus squalens]|uniref:Glyoxalase-like domain-containing protein n=1 Tax=Dichomitus squalens TaxID=114155 RepID=A0A4Q9PLV2_9APHY|nr:glyoxalase-like domain-containing protein [Dichomitus squalens]TBU55189.1 glyoxalase-like domain-containing protein [Dichomitus squalens]